MERRLNEVEWSSTSVPNDSTTGKQIFSSTPNTEHLGVDDDKDRIIRSLESEVEAQVIFTFILKSREYDKKQGNFSGKNFVKLTFLPMKLLKS